MISKIILAVLVLSVAGCSSIRSSKRLLNPDGSTRAVIKQQGIPIPFFDSITGNRTERKKAVTANEPQNLPPANYNNQYFVDRAGCVFIRTSGRTGRQWVPQVSRKRKQICGQRPTF